MPNKEAEEQKELGNAAYKKKDFETALKHYQKAAELDPSELTYLSNQGAVYFEMKKYDECIEKCSKAVEVGREQRADYKLVAKAMTRLGNAHIQIGELEKAKTWFEKSLTEHRTPQTKELLSSVEKQLKEKERLAYIDPEKAAEAKKMGNEAFQKGQYADAVKHYTEAINRAPEDAILFSNRAAAYTKLAAFDYALKDCDKCIELDPKFIKGYLRKGKVLQGLKQLSKAAEAYQRALEIDSTCDEALQGYRTCAMGAMSDPTETRKRAMGDPEVQSILKDPAMRIILEQMQSDPMALKEHLQNPDVASKIQKLLECGIISIQ
ncbi:unnamed protein product [Cyprideis torosa]|uniref:Stress-induced-phosphoprotein 1 n=1 Tax=Cyprideis torosa TaxID=163714 RepID=A0A7R8WE73_9CRUS|nr:unnamed protein product [Cyprideis torosa]CAG0895523.1 unnamed protein product [Cyprideis torosa]